MAGVAFDPYRLLCRMLATVVAVTSFAFLVSLIASIFDHTFTPPQWLGAAVLGISSGLFALVTIIARKRNGKDDH